MRNKGIFATIIITLILFSCKSEIVTNKNIGVIKHEKPFIEVDNTIFSGKKPVSEKEKKYATEIVYSSFKRASEHLLIEDGLYIFNIKNGKDIEISEPLFNIFNGIIKDTNKGILEMREQGIDANATEGGQVINVEDWNWEVVYELYNKYN
ncbi:MAG: hypothetical protein K9H49_17815 [Bacteroidales bacterium]|nr:hypothetical protein [Bacteroidales bacterium]MCF8391472.1 hypothetical protein [Bacteroidales bacterium]